MEKGFFQQPKGVPIRKRVLELGETEPVEIKNEALPVEHGIKHEMYALSAFLMERYHMRARKILKEHPEEMLKNLRDNFFLSESIIKALVVEDGTLHFDKELIRQVDAEDLRDVWTNENVFPSIYRKAFDRAFVEERDEFDEREEAVYHRLNDIFYKTHARLVLRSGILFPKVRPQSVEGFIKTGVVTACTESWNILIAVMKLYHQKFEKNLTSQTLDVLSSDIKKILNQVASLHIADFESLRSLGLEPGQPNLRQVPWEKILIFPDNEPGTRLVIREEYKHLDNDDHERKECTQGCPGREALIQNEEGRKVNMVGDILDFHKELARNLVLPYQEVLRGEDNTSE